MLSSRIQRNWRIIILTITICIMSIPAYSQYSGGTGEPNNPYQIATAQDLIDLGNEPNDYDKHFIMTADIDLDPEVTGIPAFNTAVIASLGRQEFRGVFDGNGFKISNLTIDGGYPRGYLGLFGSIYGAIIKNLGLENIEIYGDYNVGSVGGLVGRNSGSILNCYSTVAVTGGDSVGGLVGSNSGSISNCYSTGAVTGDDKVGGLSGRNSGSISNCYSTGVVIGDDDIGGIVGFNSSGNVMNCFWDIETSGISESAGGYGLSTAQMTIQETFISIGWDFVDESANGTSEIWQMPIETGYPVLSSFNGYTPITLNGDGSQNNPYLISNVADLGALYYYDSHAYYKLTSDIDLSDIQWSNAIIPVFNGSFDGNDFVIQDANIFGGGYSGLFGKIESAAVVMNLGLKNVFVSGSDYIGGLAGRNYGRITNCYSMGVVSGENSVGGLTGWNRGSVSNSFSTGLINGEDEVGSLVGNNYLGSISSSYNTGSVSGYTDVGGLVGENDRGDIIYCYSTAVVSGNSNVGGLVGFIDYGSGNSITNCYSVGKVSGISGVGGLVGTNYSYSNNITNCFWDTETSGQSKSAGGTGLLTAQMKIQSIFTSISCWDFVGESANGTSEIWQMPIEPGYPVLSSFNGYTPVILSGDGSQSNPYLISNAVDLGALYYYDNNAHYKLTSNIDLSDIQWSSTIIPVFNGSLDGNDFVIKNINIREGDFSGLFGKIGPTAFVTNLGLENVFVSGTEYVGGLAGHNSGSIKNCHSMGEVSGNESVGCLVGSNSSGIITNSFSTGSVSGNWRIGGLAGNNYGSISNCYATCFVDGENFYSGGLVAQNNGNIMNCYANGSVTGNKVVGGLVGYNSDNIINCYANGSVTGNKVVGGLLGENYFGSITSCFWDIETSGQSKSDSGTGKTTAEMQDVNTFLNVGWDFIGETDDGTEDIWWIDNGMDYPHLWWEVSE